MRTLILTIICILISIGIRAQAPLGISHQAVIRDAQGKLVASNTIGIQVSIIQGSAEGTAVYVETHAPESNVNGLITYVIGTGSASEGLFADIDWTDGPYFLKTEADPAGGTNYSIEGVTQLLSVPYALHAQTSGDAFDGDMKGKQIVNLADPAADQDAATKAYVDELENTLSTLETSMIDAGVHPYKFKDTRDGNIYKYVTIGIQVWMTENLRYLPEVVGPGTASGTTSYYYVYDYGGTDVNAAIATDNYQNYGVLYNWPAAMAGASSSSANPSGVQGVCPSGWHVPSDAEWTDLVNYVVSQGYPNSSVVGGAGNALKSCRQVGSPLGGACNTSDHPRWDSHSTHYGTDEFGFSALPGGHHSDGFDFVGNYGLWWSATEHSSTHAWFRHVGNYYGDVRRDGEVKSYGFSLRCVRDN